ncbi:MAG: 2'-5' RNA ligase family protein [Micromonosporaceae bacterium]|nr:2'-5' RNA ligase family protein [Micromonosporaceae bacterium]
MRRAAAGDPEASRVPAHLTLLGSTEIDDDDLPAIDRHLISVAARHEPFTLLLRGTGTFRPVTQVVFVAVAAGISQCERLHRAMRSIPATLRPQRFPYHPHVTVAQDVPPAQLDAVFEDLAGFQASVPVTEFTLFEHGQDARWKEQRVYPLGGSWSPSVSDWRP